MKRILAIILATAMLVSLAPAVFADGEDTAAATTYTYNFNNLAFGGTLVTDKTYSTLATGVQATGSGNTWEAIYINSYQKRIHDTGLTGNVKWANYSSLVGYAFKIDVPQKGTYIPTAVFDEGNLGGIISTRIISETERAANGWTLNNTIGITTLISEMPVTEAEKKDTWNTSAKGLTIDSESSLKLPAVELDKGSNYVVFLIDGYCDAVKEANESSAQTVQIEVRSLSLEKVSAASISFAEDEKVLAIGETATLPAYCYDSNGSEISDTITYESSAPSIVSVDSETGAVTANAAGEATITATASSGVKDTITVSSGELKRYIFDIGTFDETYISSLSNTTRIQLASAGGTDGENYENIADGYEKWDHIHSYGAHNVSVYACNTAFRLAKKSAATAGSYGIAYKISVPSAGKYKLRYNYFEDELGLITSVWFVDEADLGATGITMSGETTGAKAVMQGLTPDIAAVDTYNANVANNTSHSSGDEFKSASAAETYNLAAGEYYIVIGVAGKNEKLNNADADGDDVEDDGLFTYMLYDSVDLIKTGDYDAPIVPEADPTVKVHVYSPIDGAVTSDDVEVGDVQDIEVGTSITVSAAETSGDWTFVGWKDSSGNFVSENATDTFTIITKTVLIAVYDKKTDESATTATVEFWNRNGMLISKTEVEAGITFGEVSKPSASLNGFGSATGWSVDDSTVISGVVRAVAQYAYEDTGVETKAVKVNGTSIDSPVYNQKLEYTISGTTAWQRNGKTVAFGESYTHYIFNSANGTNIVASKGAVTVRPIVVIDVNSDGVAMIEYDAADKEILEAGIIFGAEGVSLDSYTSKAYSKNLKSHGQFIAAPNENTSLSQDVARGYIVYKDGSDYKIAYSD